jgi:adenylate cyclase class 2
MKTEIEAKFLNINHDAMRETLKSVGAVCKQPMRMMRRVTFGTPEMNSKNAFMRIRDEGYRVTMTYKQFDEMSLTGAKEIEVTVSNYEDALTLVKAAGIETKSVQEARREVWHLDDIEIMLDEWPWLNPYMEIEAETEKKVKHAASLLGLNWDDAVFGDLNQAFRAQYPTMSNEDAIYHLPDIRFDLPLPDMLKIES